MAKPGDRVALAITYRRSIEVTVGRIDRAALEAYSTGQCLALAKGLAEQTGWPLAYLGASLCNRDRGQWDDEAPCLDYPEGVCLCQIHHFGVLAPPDRLVDIRGARPLTVVLADYGCEVAVPMGPALLAAIVADRAHWPTQNWAVARYFASVVLHDLEPTAWP